MNDSQQHPMFYTVYVALIVALGGFLMGFDASVISGVVKFIEPEFELSKIELGWAVASLSLSATLAMMLAGPLSDKVGRKPVLRLAAILFLLSAIMSAIAPSFIFLVCARMIGGLGVGAALIIAPMYIAEIAPSKHRGLMVSFNQLNIVIGISVAFFTNYLILKLGQSDASWAQSLKFDEWNWRWMLGLETLPALLYLISLFAVPESPRWLIMQGKKDQALLVMKRASGEAQAKSEFDNILHSLSNTPTQDKASFKELLKPSMRLVMLVGISVAILQQITGINSVFFYAPMIFEQSGIGTDASFMQAILVGLVNLVFTLAALALIDKIGRKPLLVFGVSGIAVCMLILSFGFYSASYTLTEQSIDSLPENIDRSQIIQMQSVRYEDDLSFKAAATDALGAESFKTYETDLIVAAIKIDATLVLFGVLGFVACFAISLGPVMWVLFSELFPNRIRGIAISVVGLVNSAVSFSVQLVFPWELANFGNAITFLVYGVFAIVGLAIIMKLLPETKGKSLEELEQLLVKT
ncbi:MAG: sugar porter family MFS transporter [Pseudomonadales bacterium]